MAFYGKQLVGQRTDEKRAICIQSGLPIVAHSTGVISAAKGGHVINTRIGPRIGHGERIYAIGDIHGRLDLFTRLVRTIRRDCERRGPRAMRLILMGDLIDRGPDSAPLVERIHAYARHCPHIVILRGNHEDIMVDALGERNEEALAHWLKFGGDATLRSWGVDEDALRAPLHKLLEIACRAVPDGILRWLGKLPLSFRSGDYFFVHAGIRPGVPLRRQRCEDMLWIGDTFLRDERQHPAVIVHGHSIVENGPLIRENRIALDTGAYRTGKLSAVGFEDDQRWVLST